MRGLHFSIYRRVEVKGKEKFVFVKVLFGGIANVYDRANWMMSLGRHRSWRRESIKGLKLPQGAIALDVGSGTGDLAEMLAGKGARVVGLDISVEMLALGRRKAISKRIESEITFAQGDAMALPFPDNTFDCVVTAFTARNVVDVRRLFSEMHRVSKPNHPVMCLEFTYPTSRMVRFFYRPYLRYIVPLLGTLAGGDRQAFRYLGDSIMGFPGVNAIKSIMEEVGLTGVRIKLLNLGSVSVHTGWKGSPS